MDFRQRFQCGSSLVELFGWSIGSLLLVGLMVFSRGLRRSDYLMLAMIFGIFSRID